MLPGGSAARPQLIRLMNEQLVLAHIRAAGELSRADLARVSGLAKNTVSQALTNLERARLVRTSGVRTGVPGPQAVLYEVNPEAGFVLGLDVGSHFLRGALADLTGTVRARTTLQANALDGSATVAQLADLAGMLCHEAGVKLSDVGQTVLGSPGIYDPERDALNLVGGRPGWDSPVVLRELRERFGDTLVLENDIDAAALAEQAHGHGREVDSFAFVSVGTGIGMGLVIGGRLHRGAHGAAGEIGFLPAPAPGAIPASSPASASAASPGSSSALSAAPSSVLSAAPSSAVSEAPSSALSEAPSSALSEADAEDARRRGRLEVVAAAPGVVEAARRAGMADAVSARSIFAAAAAGDPLATSVVAAEAVLVADAICAIVAVADPDLIVLGGGIGQADGFLGRVSDHVRAHAPVQPSLRVSALGDDAVVDGCLAAGGERLWQRLTDDMTPTP
jgi:predicted NBD/HSP70 family sugar kinase